MENGPVYKELFNNRVLSYIHTHWKMFKEIPAGLAPSKWFQYRLYEHMGEPKTYLLSIQKMLSAYFRRCPIDCFAFMDYFS